MHGEHYGNAERSPRESAQKSGLRRVGGDELGPQTLECRPDLAERPQIAEWMDRHGEVPEDHDRYPESPEVIDERPATAGDHRRRVA